MRQTELVGIHAKIIVIVLVAVVLAGVTPALLAAIF